MNPIGQRQYDAHYVRGPRAFSFAHQLDSVLSLSPTSVLEVGPGPGVLTVSLRRLGVPVTTLDVDPVVNPDLLGCITDMPVDNDCFDIAICCQVLEHLPFDHLGLALAELSRVTRRTLIMSIPDVSRHIELTMRLPFSERRTFSLGAPRIRPRRFPSERRLQMGHHWEIGFREFPLRRITSVIRASHWAIARTWRIPENPWHRFFELHNTVRPTSNSAAVSRRTVARERVQVCPVAVSSTRV